MGTAVRVTVLAMLGLACSHPYLAAARTATTSGPLTFAEFMSRKSAFSAATLSPDGRWLAYVERDWRGPAGGTMSGDAQRSRVFLRDLKTGRTRSVAGAARGIFFKSMCETWSPDGAGLIVSRIKRGTMRFAYVDAVSGRLTSLAPRPTGLCGNWVGRHFLYASVAPGSAQPGSNADILRVLSDKWRQDWNTDAAVVTVSSDNPLMPSSRFEANSLSLFDPATGRARAIASGRFREVTSSPDATRFAVLRSTETDPNALEWDTGRRAALDIFDLHGSEPRLLYEQAGLDIALGSTNWSPDGQLLVVAGKPASAKREALELYVIDPAKAASRAIVPPAGWSLHNPDVAQNLPSLATGWIGGEPAAVVATSGMLADSVGAALNYGEQAGRAFHVMSFGAQGFRDLTGFSKQSVRSFVTDAQQGALVVADGALWRLSRSAPPLRLTPPGLNVRAIAAAHSSGGLRPNPSFFSGSGAERIELSVIASEGQAERVIFDVPKRKIIERGTAEGRLATSSNLLEHADVDSIGWSTTLRVAGSASAQVAVSNAEWSNRPVASVHMIKYRYKERELIGWLALPPGRRDAPVPCIVWIYPGRVLSGEVPDALLASDAPLSPVYSGQLMAAQGYAVLFVSTPTSGNPATVMAELAGETIAGIDAAASQRFIDPTRVGLIGQSFGGYGVAAVLSQRSDRFRAGVAMNGEYDFAYAWGSKMFSKMLASGDPDNFNMETIGFVENGQPALHAPAWTALDAYVRSSPFYSVRSIDAPLLIVAGDINLGTTSLAQSERLYAALRREGKSPVLVRYWGEGHVQEGEGAVRDGWSRISNWFGHYLRSEQ